MFDLDYLTNTFFTFDLPVPYPLKKNEDILYIYPISVKDGELFKGSAEVLTVNKNEISDVDIIQMSYLKFLARHLLQDEVNNFKFSFIMNKCLGIDAWRILEDNRGKVVLQDETHNLIISSNNFDEIKKIILYQNFLHFDDTYVSPDIRKMIEETNKIKNGNLEQPSLERKISIISAHTGMLKKDIIEMSYRAFESLFEEVVGEVEFITTRPIALYTGEKKFSHWIYPNKKGKFDDYITSMSDFTNSFGGKSSISPPNQKLNSHTEQLLKQYNEN